MRSGSRRPWARSRYACSGAPAGRCLSGRSRGTPAAQTGAPFPQALDAAPPARLAGRYAVLAEPAGRAGAARLKRGQPVIVNGVRGNADRGAARARWAGASAACSRRRDTTSRWSTPGTTTSRRSTRGPAARRRERRAHPCRREGRRRAAHRPGRGRDRVPRRQQHQRGSETAAAILAPDGFAITFQNGIGNVETLQADARQGAGAAAARRCAARRCAPRATSALTHMRTTSIGEIGRRRERARAAIAGAPSGAGLETRDRTRHHVARSGPSSRSTARSTRSAPPPGCGSASWRGFPRPTRSRTA